MASSILEKPVGLLLKICCIVERHSIAVPSAISITHTPSAAGILEAASTAIAPPKLCPSKIIGGIVVVPNNSSTKSATSLQKENHIRFFRPSPKKQWISTVRRLPARDRCWLFRSLRVYANLRRLPDKPPCWWFPPIENCEISGYSTVFAKLTLTTNSDHVKAL